MRGNVVLLAMLCLSVFLFGQGASEHPIYKELSRDDLARLDHQRSVVARIAKERYGTTSLTRTKADLPVLQHIIDDRVFGPQQTYELQSLGVAFGDVLASEFPLRWVMVTDEFGTDPTLRFKNTTFQINALTMISKRIEKNKAVDLADMIRFVKENLAREGQNAQ